MHTDTNQEAFLELVRAGLWGNGKTEIRIDGTPNWEELYRLAEEQSVMGLIAAGLDMLPPAERPPQEVLLQFIGSALQIEQQNKDMNVFLGRLIEKLRKADVYAILVKGQGIAQCYEKPLWRASGDIDMLLSDTSYEKAKKVLLPLAIESDTEYKSLKHLGLTMKGGYAVELHGMMHSRLSGRVDRVIDEVQKDVFFGGNVRSWQNGYTTMFLPAPDNDVIFVFTHILKHFYIEGVGLRQICDWCRLLYTYKDSLNHGLLESRIKKAGLMTEWKAFAALAVDWLGMSAEAMPLYSTDKKWRRKAERILEFVLETGSFGHNREFHRSMNFFIGKIQAAWFKAHDFARHTRVFPLDSLKFYCHYLIDGIRQAYAIKFSKRREQVTRHETNCYKMEI